jgi:hypothetical protein
MKTLDRIRYSVDRFEMSTEGLINVESRDLELRIKMLISHCMSIKESSYTPGKFQGILPGPIGHFYFSPLHQHPLVAPWRQWVERYHLVLLRQQDQTCTRQK